MEMTAMYMSTQLSERISKTTPKTRGLLAALSVILVIYVVFFTSWFRSEPIAVYHRLLGQEPGQPLPNFILPQFALDGMHELTHIRMTCVQGAHAGQVMWELKGQSLTLDQFVYGAALEGMQPVAGHAAQDLSAGEAYEVTIRSKTGAGRYQFSVGNEVHE